MLDDARIDQLRDRLRTQSPARADREPAHREAAVALLVRPRDALELLLIRRAEMEGDPWSGHVAFPGGRRSAGDTDLLVTACRETEEEIGVPAATIGSLLGELDELVPGTPLLPPIIIAPFVLAVPPDTHARPDPREVQAAIWVPFDALRDPGARSEIRIELPGGAGTFPSLVYGDYVVWGLTYRILAQFLELTGDTTR